MNAYSAASMTFNPDISKIALLNYARLSYEIGNPYEKYHSSSSNISKHTLKHQKRRAYSTFVNSYTNGGDYDGVTILTSQNNYKDDRLLQEVTFLKAIQLYNAGNYSIAGAYFQRAAKNDKVKPYGTISFLAGTNSLRTQSI